MRMTTLTHVVHWNGREWEPITARKAAIKTNWQSVSVHSGLFMCELCHQKVTLVAEGNRVPFFRHSRGGKIIRIVRKELSWLMGEKPLYLIQTICQPPYD